MGWQDVVAIAAVVGAVGYLVSLVWSGISGERKGGGAACGKCASAGPEPVAIGAAKGTRSD
jgi:hypothetical protein